MDLELSDLTFHGPEIDDAEILATLPSALRELLSQINGFIQFHGGLHVRGACHQPVWHSIREVWHGGSAFHLTYPAVNPDDVPFAQDCVGDQFLLRAGSVIRLHTETGDIDPLNLDLFGFLRASAADPIEFLSLYPLMQHTTDGGRMEAGELLSVYPPFCTLESADGVSLRPVPAQERIAFLADFYRQLGQLPSGQQFRIKIV